MSERFYITEEAPGWGDVCSPVIRDRNTGEIVCNDIYETVELLNRLANQSEEF